MQTAGQRAKLSFFRLSKKPYKFILRNQIPIENYEYYDDNGDNQEMLHWETVVDKVNTFIQETRPGRKIVSIHGSFQFSLLAFLPMIALTR